MTASNDDLVKADTGEGPMQEANAHLIALAPELAAEVIRLRAEVADLKSSVIAFGAPAMVRHAMDHGLPQGHLMAHHYDILKAAGARMSSFFRIEPKEIGEKGKS